MLAGDYGRCSPKHHFASGPAEDILIAEAKSKMVSRTEVMGGNPQDMSGRRGGVGVPLKFSISQL